MPPWSHTILLPSVKISVRGHRGSVPEGGGSPKGVDDRTEMWGASISGREQRGAVPSLPLLPSFLHALEHGAGDLAALLRLELLRALVEAEAVLPGVPVHVVDALCDLTLEVALGRDRPVGRLRLLRRV